MNLFCFFRSEKKSALVSNKKNEVILIVLFFILLSFSINLKAQFPNPSFFNTATNSTGTGTLSYLATDLNWTAAMTSSLGTYTPAVVVGTQPGWSNSPYTNTNWIVYPHTCSVSPADHSCNALTIDEYYKLIFTLPSLACGQSVSTPSAYCLSLDFMADNCVKEIFVNGVLNYFSPVVTPSGYTGFLLANKVTVSLCNNWLPGTNTIIVHVVSGAYATGGLTGFLAQTNSTVNTTIGIPVSAASSQSNPVCFGGAGSATVIASGGSGAYTYSWLPSGGTASVASGLAAGNYSCIVTSSNLCSFTKTLNITQPSALSLSLSASSSSACVGNSILLSSVSSGGTPGYSYTWTAGPNTSTYSTSRPSGAYVYTMSSRDLNNCLATNTIALSFIAIPVLNTSSVSICQGALVTLTVSGANAYTWNPSGFVGNTFTSNPLVSTTYTITGNSAGCSSSATAFVNVPPSLSLGIVASSPSVCLGNSIFLTATCSGGIPGYMYYWASGPLSSTYTVNQAVAGSYTYFVSSTDANNCSITNSTVLNFYSSVVLNSPTISICPGKTGTLSVSGASTYTWFPSGQTGSSFTASPNSATVYSVTGTSTAGCIASTTSTVFIRASPTLSFNTFSITCASLGSATVSGTGGIGPFSYTWNPTFQTSAVANGLYPGNYTVSVFDSGTGCVFTPTTNFASLIPLTGTVSSTTRLPCYGISTGTAGISLSGGSGFQTYNWLDANGSQSVALAQNLAAGVNTVIVSDLITHCSVTHTFFINQPSSFSVSISPSTNSVCLGGSINFTVTNSGGTPAYSYTCSGGVVSSTFTVNELSAGTYSYGVIGKDANNCSFGSLIFVSFVNNPLISITDASICPLANASLSAQGASTYTWNTGFIGNPLIASPLTNTQYTVIGSAAGCTSSAISNIILKPVPVAAFSNNAPLCQGASLQLSGLGSYPFYIWTGPSGYTSTSQTTTFTNAQPSLNGTYQLKVIAANNCSAVTSGSVLVRANPILAVSGSTVCEAQALYLYANFIPNVSYSWLGSGFSSTLQTPVILNADTLMTGIYQVTVTSIYGCTASAVTNAMVVKKPLVSANSNNIQCVGSNLNLFSNGGNTYQWHGPNFFYSALQNPSISIAQLQNAGIYTVTAFFGPCVGSDTVLVNLFALPIPTITSNSPLCESSLLQLSGSGGTNYNWTGPASYTSNSSFNAFPATLNAGGVYTLMVTDTHSCIGRTSKTILVLPAPQLSANGASVCAGESAILKASGGMSYFWSGPSGFTSTLSQPIIPIVTNTNSGSYTVVISDQNTCTNAAVVQLIAYPYALPTPVINSASIVCLYSNFTLKGSGGGTYLWSGPNAFTASTQTLSLFVKDLTMAGIYTLSVKNESNCSASSTVQLLVMPLPSGTLISTATDFCVPNCPIFRMKTESGSRSITSMVFTFDSDFRKDSVYHPCFTKAGTYTVHCTFNDTNQCSNTVNLLITVRPKPIADFDYKPYTPLANSVGIDFLNFSSGEQITKWNWFFNSNTTDTVFEKSPHITFDKAGTYPVVLIVKNKWGCADTVIKPIVIEDEFSLYIPNAFSPNGDFKNDYFQAKGQGVREFSLTVFSRWGELIFETSSFEDYWDGTFKGKSCEEDTYVWKVEAKDDSGKSHHRSGNVTLIK